MKTSSIMSEVDWNAYSRKYDMLLAFNPFYQEAFQRIMDQLKAWNIQAGGKVADLGAGTGNYSVEVARLFPEARILHIDSNPTMNKTALEKAEGLQNFSVLDQGIHEVEMQEQSLNGLLCINALYTFPEPEEALQKMYNWMIPGAKAVFLDPGRIMNMFSWRVAISRYLIKTYGLRKTLAIFKEAKVVGQQNAYIRAMQKNGTYWTHSHEEFCKTLERTGFEIETSSICFKGDCDLVLARRPEA